MNQNEFRSLPFAEARAKLLEEMGIEDAQRPSYRRPIDVHVVGHRSVWPLRFGNAREG